MYPLTWSTRHLNTDRCCRYDPNGCVSKNGINLRKHTEKPDWVPHLSTKVLHPFLPPASHPETRCRSENVFRQTLPDSTRKKNPVSVPDCLSACKTRFLLSHIENLLHIGSHIISLATFPPFCSSSHTAADTRSSNTLPRRCRPLAMLKHPALSTFLPQIRIRWTAA